MSSVPFLAPVHLIPKQVVDGSGGGGDYHVVNKGIRILLKDRFMRLERGTHPVFRVVFSILSLRIPGVASRIDIELDLGERQKIVSQRAALKYSKFRIQSWLNESLTKFVGGSQHTSMSVASPQYTRVQSEIGGFV